ncbi:MAG: hypothetical protein IJ650_04160 [Paludibacteraceae bacterium]|nr:hypothetical protein [Paludibacteraceae bacterium]
MQRLYEIYKHLRTYLKEFIMTEEKQHILLLGWMETVFHLSGLEEKLFAVIYGFCRYDQGLFIGTTEDLAGWCNCSIRQIVRCLSYLRDRGLVSTRDGVYGIGQIVKDYENGLKNTGQNVTLKGQNVTSTGQNVSDKMSPHLNNIINNNIYNNTDENGNGGSKKIAVGTDILADLL